MIKSVAACAALAFLAPLVAVRAHDEHDHPLQMPLDYVKFPFQAVYPGDNEGLTVPRTSINIR